MSIAAVIALLQSVLVLLTLLSSHPEFLQSLREAGSRASQQAIVQANTAVISRQPPMPVQAILTSEIGTSLDAKGIVGTWSDPDKTFGETHTVEFRTDGTLIVTDGGTIEDYSLKCNENTGVCNHAIGSATATGHWSIVTGSSAEQAALHKAHPFDGDPFFVPVAVAGHIIIRDDSHGYPSYSDISLNEIPPTLVFETSSIVYLKD